ncbi:transglutaminase domain-containing protein [Thermoactinospora rubra]|uniref:transglutaminase domain-containing protein n=1 Tax=Thermoactinospora rubra TaxID=1088767 RepID=UPI0019813EE7|nr:transglutaminase domain-containing protein [Thermoactinospora rubra]
MEPTPILDWRHPRVAAVAAQVTGPGLLRDAHRLIGTLLRPVYAMNEAQPVSVTLARGRGSCSQRMAVLEAVARSHGIATRVRGLLVEGRFWERRLPRLRALLPREVVPAWPEFLVDDQWIAVSELYGTRCGEPFTNAGPQTLFEAVATTAVDWDGTACPSCDLSGHVLADLGRFDSRDELFRVHGQTLCRPARIAADLLVSRVTP